MVQKIEVNRIYDLCVNSTYEQTEYNNNLISLIDLRDLAIDGSYEDNEMAYKSMIRQILKNMYSDKGDY